MRQAEIYFTIQNIFTYIGLGCLVVIILVYIVWLLYIWYINKRK